MARESQPLFFSFLHNIFVAFLRDRNISTQLKINLLSLFFYQY